jgi:hypothetical protein
MHEAIPPLPQYDFMAWYSVKKKHRDNFTFASNKLLKRGVLRCYVCEYTSLNPISLRYILILSSHLRLGLARGPLPWEYPTKIWDVFISLIRATWPVHLTLIPPLPNTPSWYGTQLKRSTRTTLPSPQIVEEGCTALLRVWVYILKPYFVKIRFNIILPYMPGCRTVPSLEINRQKFGMYSSSSSYVLHGPPISCFPVMVITIGKLVCNSSVETTRTPTLRSFVTNLHRRRSQTHVQCVAFLPSFPYIFIPFTWCTLNVNSRSIKL